MKMLKRAGAIAIAGAMALTLGSVAYAADPTITVGDINISPAEDGIVTVTVPYTAENLATGAQVTLLAELGAKEGVYAESIVYETTAYIDQDAAGSEFTFKINQSRLVGDEKADVWLNVKVGGTGVATAAEGSVLAYDYKEVVTPTSPVTNEMISGAVDSTITDAYGTTGAVISRLDITELVANSKIDLTKQTVKIGGVEAKYTLYNDTYKVVYAGPAITADTTVEVVDSATGMTRLYYGDTNGSSTSETPDDITALDATPVINHVLKTGTIVDNYALVVADTNADGNVSALDATPIINIVLRTASSVPATTK